MALHQKKIQRLVRKIIPVLKRNGVVKAGIFGSYARGEEKKGSDVDLLIKQKGPKSLLDLVRLERELKEKLGIPVDLLDYQGLSPYLKERILKEERRII